VAQPEFVQFVDAERQRIGERIPPVKPGGFDRPGMLHHGQPTGPRLGVNGPDQGYALKLARNIRPRLVLAPHEHEEDVVIGCVEVAMRRAAHYGRAPVGPDLELAFSVFGFLAKAPDDLVAYRRPLFEGADHRYNTRLDIGGLVPAATLQMKPAEVAAQVAAGKWRELLETPTS
jgi:hypothetical protein